MSNERFPIDLNGLKPLKLDPGKPSLTDEQRAALQAQHSIGARCDRFLHGAGRREGPVRAHGRRLRHRSGGHDHPGLHRQRRAHRAGLLRRGRPSGRHAVSAERAERRHAGGKAAALPRIRQRPAGPSGKAADARASNSAPAGSGTSGPSAMASPWPTPARPS